MASLEELVLTAKQNEKVEVEEFASGEDDMMSQDILDALSLLSKCTHLLDYLSDLDLCKSITKKERGSMANLSEQVKTYLDEVEHNYEDVEVEEEE